MKASKCWIRGGLTVGECPAVIARHVPPLVDSMHFTSEGHLPPWTRRSRVLTIDRFDLASNQLVEGLSPSGRAIVIYASAFSYLPIAFVLFWLYATDNTRSRRAFRLVHGEAASNPLPGAGERGGERVDREIRETLRVGAAEFVLAMPVGNWSARARMPESRRRRHRSRP